MAIQLVATIVLFVMSIYIYIFGYQMIYNDPIINMKKTFLIFQTISIGIALFSLGISTVFSRKKEHLAQLLLIIATLFTVMLLFHFGLKMYLDSVFVESTFAEFYTTYEKPNEKPINTQNLNAKQIIKLKTDALQSRQKYIDDSLYAYNNFRLKVTLNIGIEILIVLLSIYLMYRIETKVKKKVDFERNDDIFYNR